MKIIGTVNVVCLIGLIAILLLFFGYYTIHYFKGRKTFNCSTKHWLSPKQSIVGKLLIILCATILTIITLSMVAAASFGFYELKRDLNAAQSILPGQLSRDLARPIENNDVSSLRSILLSAFHSRSVNAVLVLNHDHTTVLAGFQRKGRTLVDITTRPALSHRELQMTIPLLHSTDSKYRWGELIVVLDPTCTRQRLIAFLTGEIIRILLIIMLVSLVLAWIVNRYMVAPVEDIRTAMVTAEKEAQNGTLSCPLEFRHIKNAFSEIQTMAGNLQTMLATLHEREETFRALASNSPDAVMRFDPQKKLLFINPTACKMFLGGISSSLLDHSLAQLQLTPDAIRQWEQAFDEVTQHCVARRLETALPSGRWVDSLLVPELTPKGTLKAVLLTSRDITESKKGESALRASEQKYHELADLLPQPIFECTAHGLITFANHCAFEEFGYSQDDFVRGLNIFDMISPEDRNRAASAFQSILNGCVPRDLEYTAMRKDGSRLPIIIYASPIRRDEHVVGMRGLIMDLSERKQAEIERQHIETERMRFRDLSTLLNCMPGIACYKDQNGFFLTANDMFCKNLGVTPEKLVGKTVFDLFPRDIALLHQAHDDKIIRGIESVIEYQETMLIQGHPQSMSIRKVPVHDASGKIIGLIALGTDITARLQQEEELRAAKEHAESATRTKNDFLATMSHEIRTPLNAVLGFANLLYDTNLTSKQREYLEIIHTRGHDLLSLINDILDLTRIESGHIELEEKPFSLHKIVNDIMGVVSLKTREKGLAIYNQVDNNVPDHLIGDALRLKQILFNLLNNALKFTAQGQIFLKVSMAGPEHSCLFASQPQAAVLHFSITDTGVGIEPEHKAVIFNPFTQGDGSYTRKFGGTGLGLTICRKLAEKMNGNIWVDSTPGKGSTFHVTAVFQRPVSVSTSRGSYTTPPPTRCLNILLAEDDPTSRLLMVTMLHQEGHQVLAVENGHVAYEKVSSGATFDIIFMDWQMPVMDGIKATQCIRAWEEQNARKKTPVIALTALAMKGDAEKCLAAGMNAYVSKPFEKHQLYAAIHSVMQVQPPPKK